MAAEFFIVFKDAAWYAAHLRDIESRLEKLSTFVQRQGNEFQLRGTEPERERWAYDVRLIFLDEPRMLMEISARPRSVEADLLAFLASLRSETDVAVVDEDGERSGW